MPTKTLNKYIDVDLVNQDGNSVRTWNAWIAESALAPLLQELRAIERTDVTSSEAGDWVFIVIQTSGSVDSSLPGRVQSAVNRAIDSNADNSGTRSVLMD